MNSLHRRLTLLVMLCTGGCASTGTKPIAVPTADPRTPPAVVLDVHFPQGPILTVTPTGNTPLVPTQLNGNNVNLDTETLSNVDTVLRFQFAAQAAGSEFTAVRAAMRTN